MTPSPIFIIAGEASGDLHGAHLLSELLKKDPSLICYAMGGKQLAKAGATLLVDAAQIAVVGFVEVLSKLWPIRRAFKKVLNAIQIHQPNVVVLIDYPGFNLRLAKAIKRESPHTKVIYYISPQIWAWRYHRIHTIKKFVDLMAVIFPFEVKLYEQESVPVKFVGNALTKKVHPTLPFTERLSHFNLSKQARIIGLMPGSRHSELKNIFPILLKAAKLLHARDPSIQFVLPLASTLNPSHLAPYLSNSNVPIQVVQELHYDAMSLCDAIIVASGTATLEVALLGRPMVIVYKGSSLSFAIAKFFVKLPYIGLCNIVAEERIVPELLQEKATPENIYDEVLKIFDDETHSRNTVRKLQAVREQLIAPEESNLAELITPYVLTQ